jgi:hypothetical protein
MYIVYDEGGHCEHHMLFEEMHAPDVLKYSRRVSMACKLIRYAFLWGLKHSYLPKRLPR